MRRLALALCALACCVLVFEFAVLSSILASNPWVKAVPVLLPLAALMGAAVFSLSKDDWLPALVKGVAGILLPRPLVLAMATTASMGAAGLLGFYLWELSHKKPGLYVVQVYDKNDIAADQRKGVQVLLQHKMRSGRDERSTGADGRAEFQVDVTDIFSILISRVRDGQQQHFVVTSDGRVDEKTHRGLKPVKLADVPDLAWIRPEKQPDAREAEGPSAGVIAKLPGDFFRWRESKVAPHIFEVEVVSQTRFPFDLPQAESVIARKAFTIGFSPVLRMPRWAIYKIAPGQSLPREPSRYKPDPGLPASFQASGQAYRGTGYDRAHLVRRIDLFGLGSQGVAEVDLLSSIVPQLAFVNRKTWVKVEDVASRQGRNGDTYVLRGPVFKGDEQDMVNASMIGPERIFVPTHYFQITLTAEEDKPQVQAYLVPNTYVVLGSDESVAAFETSVAEIEKLTGLRFDDRLKR